MAGGAVAAGGLQGAETSQWDDIALFDESLAFRERRDRLQYTAVTRAAEQVPLVM